MNSPKTYAILLLALTTVGGAALAYRQYHELVELRGAAMNRDERADMQKRIWDLEKLNREMADQLAALRAESDDMGGLLATADGQNADRASRNNTDNNGRGGRGGRGGQINFGQQQAALRELANKPEVQALIDTQRKLAVEQRYASLFRSLGVSGEQAEKLKTLLADRQTTMQDVIAAAREQGIDPRNDREAFRKLVADAQNEVNNGIKSVIGEGGFAQLQTYEQTLPQRNLVDQLQQRLSYTNNPLNQSQADQLVQILAANTPPRPAGPNGEPPQGGRGGFGGGGRGGDLGALAGAFLGGGPGGGLLGGLLDGGGRGGGAAVAVTPAVVNQAQSVLSQPQLTALQQIQQQQQATQQLRKLVNDTLTANQPAATTNRAGGTTGGATTGTAPAPGPTGGNTRRRGGG